MIAGATLGKNNSHFFQKDSYKYYLTKYQLLSKRFIIYLYRTSALTTLQRSLLFHDLQTLSSVEWEAAFTSVLFPMLSQLLIKSKPGERTAMEETRTRAATLLGKVFLQHLTPLATLQTFTALWLTILDFMEKFIKAATSDLLADAVPELLKNMLLVMDTAGIFVTFSQPISNEQGNTTPLWELTWDKLDTFLPQLMPDLFGYRQRADSKIGNTAAIPLSPSYSLPPQDQSENPANTQDPQTEDTTKEDINEKIEESCKNDEIVYGDATQSIDNTNSISLSEDTENTEEEKTAVVESSKEIADLDDNQTHIEHPTITTEEPSLIQASSIEVASAEIVTEVAEASTEVDVSQTFVISPIDPPIISSSNNVHSSPSKELSSEHSHAMEVSKEDNEVKSVDLSPGVVTLPETVATSHETTSVELTSMPRVGSMEETEISNGRTVSGPPISLPMPQPTVLNLPSRPTIAPMPPPPPGILNTRTFQPIHPSAGLSESSNTQVVTLVSPKPLHMPTPIQVPSSINPQLASYFGPPPTLPTFGSGEIHAGVAGSFTSTPITSKPYPHPSNLTTIPNPIAQKAEVIGRESGGDMNETVHDV